MMVFPETTIVPKELNHVEELYSYIKLHSSISNICQLPKEFF